MPLTINEVKERNKRIARRCISSALQELDLAIQATPTGEIREELTEINIKLLLLNAKMED